MQRMVILCFITMLAVGLYGCKRQPQPVEQTVDVSIITVVPKDVPITPEYVAQVQSSRQVNIQARVNGFLEKRVYTEGEIVKEGQTLFLMDQKPFQTQLDQANAALTRQEAAFEIARKNLERVQPLVEADALSQKDLDEAKGHYESTAASVEQAKAAVEQAQLNLSYTVITSPVTGITSSAQQADGTYLSMANSLLTSVAVISPAYVNFSLSENERLSFRNQITKGLIVEPQDKKYVTEVILADGSIFPYTGQVTFAEPFFNPQTGTFLIRATVENPDGLLRPNQYVRIRLKGAIRPNAILVPQRAVQNASKGHFVWVVDKDNKVEQRPVVVGQWHENDWFIDEGLHADDKVVVEGLLSIRPGMTVQIKSAAEQTAAPKTNR